MGIFIGGPRDGQRVTGRDLMGGPVLACPLPVPEFDPNTVIEVAYYHQHVTKYGPYRTVFHYVFEGLDRDDAEKRALSWHSARPWENDNGLEEEARAELRGGVLRGV